MVEAGQDLPSFPRPFPRLRHPSLAALRIALDESEHFFPDQNASVASLRRLTGIIPDSQPYSLRNWRSPSAEFLFSRQRLETVPLPWFATQTFAPSKATSKGRVPTLKVPRLTPSIARSFVTLLLKKFATQMLSPSKARP
jgi:hypothetical protein